MGKKTRKNKRGGGYPEDTALIKAVSGGDLKSTIAALDRGANPNAAYEKTILNYAFQHSGPDRNNIVYALITGVRVSIKRASGQKIIHLQMRFIQTIQNLFSF